MNTKISVDATFLDADFKDASPIDTVNRIKGILTKHNIQTQERWLSTGVPYCYALQLTVAGTLFGSNGKGLSKEFAAASAYGELMERLQLGYIVAPGVQKSGYYSVDNPQNTTATVDELLSHNPHWYARQAECLKHYTNVEMSSEQILRQFADANDHIVCTPYFSMTAGKKVLFPAALSKRVYTSNGCAAGNTMAEAVVQAISEIVERHQQLRIMHEHLSLPDIPDSFLQQFPVAYSIIEYIRSHGYRVMIKDCSLGEKFPVIGVCMIDSVGQYHVHIGAYPKVEIALERALTESFQGHSIDNVVGESELSYQTNTYDFSNIYRDITFSKGHRHPGYFIDPPSFPFNKTMGFAGKTSQELFKDCIAFLTSQDYDVLIRDCSCLDFPTYQVIVPGYSEVFACRLCQKMDTNRYYEYAQKALRNLSCASASDLLALIKHINQMAQVSDAYVNHFPFITYTNLCVNITSADNDYLMAASMAYVYYKLGKYGLAAEHIQKMLAVRQTPEDDYLLCLKRLLDLHNHQYAAEEIQKILAFFHRPETVDKLYGCLKENRNPLEDFILHCDHICSQDCKLHAVCWQKRTDALSDLVYAKTGCLDFEAFSKELQALL